MFYYPVDQKERRNEYYSDLVTNVGIAMCDKRFEQIYGKSKFGCIADAIQFSNNPSVETALGIGLSRVIAYGIEAPVTAIVMEACLAAGIAATPAGLIAAGAVGLLSTLGSDLIIDALKFLFESGSSGPFIYVDFWEKLLALPIKKPDGWDDDDEGGPGGIEFRVIKAILNFASTENVLSSKANIFFKTEFKEDVENAFNSICLPEFRGKSIQSYFETIMREVSDGVDVTSQLPYISLQFNKNHQLYSVMPSYYKQTLIGNVLTYLDYFLKGFVNGGFFTINFIQNWIKEPPNTRVTNVKILNANLVDIRKALKKIHIRYKSLYDLVDQDRFTGDFSSAFRIVGEMSKINLNDDIIFPEETFSVEHDFFPSPRLKKELAADSSKIDDILAAYHKMRNIVKKIMPQIPEFRGFFVILDMITFALHYNASMKSIGKEVQTPNAFQITHKDKEYVNIIPDVFPPLPILEQKKVVVQLTFGEIIESLRSTTFGKEIKEILINEQEEFSSTFNDEMKIKLTQLYRNKVSALMGDDFKDYDDEDIDVDSFIKKTYYGMISIVAPAIKYKIYTFYTELIEKIQSINPDENIVADEIENMSFIQIEEVCQDTINIIGELLKKKEDDLRNSISTYEKQMLIAQEKSDLDSYNKNLQKKNQAENDLPILINENKELLMGYNFTLKMFSSHARDFYSTYRLGFNISHTKNFDICIWKPVIKGSDDNRNEIIGGCLVDLNKTPKFHSNPTPTKLTTEIHSFIKSRKTKEDFIKCSSDISGFVISLDVEPSYRDGVLLVCNRIDDFFKNQKYGINKSGLSHYATKHNYIKYIEKMSVEECNAKTLDNVTPAHIACSDGNILTINSLINKNADFGFSPSNGISPFLLAMMNDNYNAAIFILLNDKAKIGNINQSTENGKTPLFWAIQYNHSDMVKLLLEKNASILSTLKSNGMTPVHYACFMNRPECLYHLLNKFNDESIYAPTEAGYTPLQLAIAHSPQCARFILESKKESLTSIDPHNYTLYDIAILNGEYEIAKSLPKHGIMIFDKYHNLGGSKNVEFTELCQAFGSGDLSLTETTFDNWFKLYGKLALSKDQEKKLIERAYFGRRSEFVEILSRVINLKRYPDLAVNAAKNGLADWILEIQKYGGDVMKEVDKLTIFDIAVDNSDYKFLEVAFKDIDHIPEKIIKRIVKRSVEIDDFKTMATISNELMKGRKSFCLLSPSDIIFSNTSSIAFQIYKRNIDKRINFHLDDFITITNSDLLEYLLNDYNFKDEDKINACKKALKNKRNFNSYLITQKNQSLIERIARDRSYSKVRQLTKENLDKALQAFCELNKKILLEEKKKIQQLKEILTNIFDFSDNNIALSAGQSIQTLWFLKVLPKWCIDGFYLLNEAFEDVEIESLLRKLYSIFEGLYRPDIKKVVLMFMNSLRKLDFDDLNKKGYGDEFVSALFEVMKFQYVIAVDDDDNTIFHISSQFSKISKDNIELMINTIQKSKLSLLNSRNRFGETIIMKLASSGNYQAFMEIDKLKADLKYRDIYGNNVLHKLINGKNATNNNLLFLIGDIINRYPEMILQKNRKGKSPFMLAAKKGFKGIVAIMSTYYPIDVLDSCTKYSVLHLAAKHDKDETIGYIVQHLHVDVNIKNKEGLTPLHFAAMRSCAFAFKKLLELGGNPLIVDNENEMSSIDYALKYGSLSIINTVTKTFSFNYTLSSSQIIVNLAFNPNAYSVLNCYLPYIDKEAFHACDSEGNNLISVSCISNNRKFVSDLLLYGCDPEKTSFLGQNSIHICAKYDSIGCSSLIFDYLHEVRGKEGVKRILDYQDSNGNLPIHIAAKKGLSGFLVHLLSACKNQDIEKENNLKHSALAESLLNDHFKVAGIISGFWTNVLKKPQESLINSLTLELKLLFKEISKLDEFILGMNIGKEIKDFQYSKHSTPKKKLKKSEETPLKEDNFLTILKNSKISIPQKLIDQCTRIINNITFQYTILFTMKCEGSKNTNSILQYISELNSPRIRDITCLILLPKLQQSTTIIKLLKMIKQIDELKISYPHPLFSWIENGLISVAETEIKPDLVLESIQNIVDLIIFIDKNPELKSSLQYPVLPAPIHVISRTIKLLKNEKYKRVQIKFINLMKESMTWNKEPSLSIDFCNRIEMEQNDLFEYVLENDFGADIIERVIEITIDLYQNSSLSDQIRKIILTKCKEIIENDKTEKSGSSLKMQIGALETNIMKVIQKYGIAYLQSNLMYIPCTSLDIANRALIAIATIGNPKIADKKLIRKGITKLENKAEEMEKDRFVESRNLDEVINAFKSGSEEFIPYKYAFDGTPVIKLSNNELRNLYSFGQLVETKRNFVSISDTALEYGKTFRDQPTILNAAKLVGLVRYVIREVFNVNPFIVQCLTVGAQLFHRVDKKIRPELKGRIAQVATGEGKSIIIAMLASCIALTGNTVDIISSSIYLAQRDAEKFKPFYEKLGLTCGCILENQKNDFDFHILYSTNTEFEFALLREGVVGTTTNETTLLYENTKRHRPYMTAIVDEVDNLFIDTAVNSARIAQHGNSDQSWIFKPIWEEVCKNNFDQNLIRNKLRKAANNEKQINVLDNISDFKLKRLIERAKTALKLQKDVNYVIGRNKMTNELEVQIVDTENTGRIQYGSRWSSGLHEFVELKEGLPNDKMSLTIAAISHPSYFELYEEIYGLTGTLGEESERNEIKQIYHVDTFDVPPNKKCLRKREKTLIVKTDEKKMQLIVNKIKEITNMKRPILIILLTIEESKKLSKLLDIQKIDHFVLNDQQQQDEDFIVNKAGKPGAVTIATNTAGRGTDIRVDEKALKKGGLHTLITFFPANLRVECQALGRSGRQGNPGSCQIIYSDKELGNDDIRNPTKDEILRIAYERRTLSIQMQSNDRMKHLNNERELFDILKQYFDYIRIMKSFLESSESESLLKASHLNSATILNELTDRWMEYFSSISSGDDEIEPSFKEFLKRWDFKNRYPSLWKDFSRIFPEKSFDLSKSKRTVMKEKPKKEEIEKPKDTKPKIMRFPSEPSSPSPIISYPDEIIKKKRKIMHIKPPKIVSILSSDSDRTPLNSPGPSVEIKSNLKIKFFFESQFRAFTEELSVDTTISQIEKMIAERIKINKKIIVQYEDNDGNKVAIDSNMTLNDIIDDMKVHDPDSEIKYYLYIKLEKIKIKSKKYYMPTIKPI